MNEIVVKLTIAAVSAIVGFMIAKLSGLADRRSVYRWLKANTRDEPGASHVGTIAIAKGIGLLEDRVRRACITSRKIYRAPGDLDQWSVWRMEPQSVYEKNGGRIDAW